MSSKPEIDVPGMDCGKPLPDDPEDLSFADMLKRLNRSLRNWKAANCRWNSPRPFEEGVSLARKLESVLARAEQGSGNTESRRSRRHGYGGNR